MRKLMLALLLVSCGEGVAPAIDDGSSDVLVTPPPAPTLASRLADGVQLFLLPSSSGGFVEARQVPARFERLPLRVTSGTIHLSAVGGVDWLQVRFADVALFGSGVSVTDLRVTAVPLADSQLHRLAVAGSWRGPGGAVTPFETQWFENVPIDLALALDDEAQVSAHFRIVSRGEVPTFRLDGFFETGAAMLDGLASETGVVVTNAAPQ